MSQITVNLKVWRQASPGDAGRLVDYRVDGISRDMSFLEMLDVVNDGLIRKGDEPIAFDSDCREGICGACGMMIDGIPHGPNRATTTCQLHMRHFRDGQTVTIEPFRARAFPVLRDLIVDRAALDQIIESGGFISANTGSAPEANMIPIPKPVQELSMDAAECIGCGACVAACPNGSAMLFTGAKVTHLGLLPQGQPERLRRVGVMVARMDLEGFGGCTNFGECHEACPKEISIDTITRMNRDFLRAGLPSGRAAVAQSD